jgi:hypothetical protein
MNRRHFIGAIAPVAAGWAQSASARIKRITLAPIQGRFHKFVTMNAYDTARPTRTALTGATRRVRWLCLPKTHTSWCT